VTPRANAAATAVLLAAALSAGCASAPLYRSAGPRPPASSVSGRGQWRLTGDLRRLAAATDGETRTAAVSEQQYRAAELTVDLGKPCVFNTVVIEHGMRPAGFCRRVAVLTSLDGKQYERRLSVPGTRRVTTVCLLTPMLARYVRVQAEVPGDGPWHIAELYVQ
jgi:hypothetical protein